MVDLSPWQTFYEIVGCSAGSLIGLQFVVIALIASLRRRANLESVNAFGSPTIVHFSGALAIAAFTSVPWPRLAEAALILILFGIGSLAYGAIVVRRTRRQKIYTPDFEDWFWYAIFPCAAHIAIIVGGILLCFTRIAPFMIAAAALALLFIAIHNAWDSVIFIVIAEEKGEAQKSE
jgi:hypothetical protein